MMSGSSSMKIYVKGGMAKSLIVALSLVSIVVASPQDSESDPARKISLEVVAGTPLRLFLTKRVSKQSGASVEAKLLAPLYAFDHEVVPAGTQVLGHVSRVQPVSKWERIRAILGGDFSPLRIAQIEFTSLLPTGGPIEVHTIETDGLKSLVPLKPPKQPKHSGAANNTGIVSAGKEKARAAIDAKIDQIKSIPDMVRGPGKKEWLYDYAMSRLPYHPQYVHNRTRFDAELKSPLSFGSESVTQKSLALLGSQPAAGSIVHARLLTPVDSMTSKQGEKVEAVLEEPLFSADHRLVLPEGTLVDGSVSMAKKAGWFHRGGRLRFDFQNVELTAQSAELVAPPAGVPSRPLEKLQFRTQATLNAAESANAPIKVDKEGGVQATESKTRFIGTALAALIASRAGDNEADHARGGSITGNRPNVGGRTLGGGMGFGLLGSIASQSSPAVGAAFGYYGLAWNVYSTVIARGAEVQFGRNSVIDIGFNQRTPDNPAKK
jgi:hypothetical protein